MTDRKLLELAAKAAGIDLSAAFWDGGRDGFYWVTEARSDWVTEARSGRIKYWNPLHDNGDALALAVRLNIDLSFYPDKEAVVYAQTKHLLGYGADGYASYQAYAHHSELYKSSDPEAATRRAVVRAAAEVGRAMT
jgi:hypothetical protein